MTDPQGQVFLFLTITTKREYDKKCRGKCHETKCCSNPVPNQPLPVRLHCQPSTEASLPLRVSFIDISLPKEFNMALHYVLFFIICFVSEQTKKINLWNCESVLVHRILVNASTCVSFVDFIGLVFAVLHKVAVISPQANFLQLCGLGLKVLLGYDCHHDVMRWSLLLIHRQAYICWCKNKLTSNLKVILKCFCVVPLVLHLKWILCVVKRWPLSTCRGFDSLRCPRMCLTDCSVQIFTSWKKKFSFLFLVRLL